jgi:hypothetical protein
MTERGVEKKPSNGTWYLGVALADPDAEPPCREPGEDDHG